LYNQVLTFDILADFHFLENFSFICHLTEKFINDHDNDMVTIMMM